MGNNRNRFKYAVRIIGYGIIVPMISSIVGSFLYMAVSTELAVLPGTVGAVILILLARKKHLAPDLAWIYGALMVMSSAVITILMIASGGSVEGKLLYGFTSFMMVLFPGGLILNLVGQTVTMLLMIPAAYLTGAVAVLIMTRPAGIRRPVAVMSLTMAAVLALNSYLYINRPAARYGGHGFDYMNGYSSTDLTDYTVYAENSKLVTLDHPAQLQITDEKDMPVMDGAEACYPLYAAMAKAVYKDIEGVEKSFRAEAGDSDRYIFNGKIVTFTNTVHGFYRLISDNKEERADLFFGARPSREQMEMAEEEGVQLEITPIGREAFVFFTEKDNPVDSLTADELRDIYSGKITNWKEVGGKDQKIVAFQRPEGSGSQTMMVYFMGDAKLKKPETYETVDAMEGVINEVAQYNDEAGALGYSFRYFLEGLHQEGDVKMISVDGVEPSVENVENGTYPLAVDLCMVTRKDDPNPNVQKMVEFALSDDGQEIIRKTGYSPLP